MGRLLQSPSRTESSPDSSKYQGVAMGQDFIWFMRNTFVWHENLESVHSFKNQTVSDDYVVYYLKNSYFWGLFSGLRNLVASSAHKYRAEQFIA